MYQASKIFKMSIYSSIHKIFVWTGTVKKIKNWRRWNKEFIVSSLMPLTQYPFKKKWIDFLFVCFCLVFLWVFFLLFFWGGAVAKCSSIYTWRCIAFVSLERISLSMYICNACKFTINWELPRTSINVLLIVSYSIKLHNINIQHINNKIFCFINIFGNINHQNASCFKSPGESNSIRKKRV